MSEETNLPRESLKLIQTSAINSTSLIGNSRQSIQKKRSLGRSDVVKKSKVATPKGFTVYVDKRSVEVQTEQLVARDLSAHDLTSEEVGIDYWKSLAEARRKALEDSLRENEMLHGRNNNLEEQLESECGQVKNLKELIRQLESDHEKHEELKKEAEKLAETVKMMAGFLDVSDSEEDADHKTRDTCVPEPVENINSTNCSVNTGDSAVRLEDESLSDERRQVELPISALTKASDLSATGCSVLDAERKVPDISIAVSVDTGDQVSNASSSQNGLSSPPMLPTTILSSCQSSLEDVPTVLEDLSSSPENDRRIHSVRAAEYHSD